MTIRASILAGAALCAWPGAALAEPDEPRDPAAIVVTAPGGAIDSDDAIRLDPAALARGGRPDLLSALTREVAGISLQQAQGNPWQPNLVYRGFTASPLQGQAQGLAVYLDGGRFNQPFGDTVGFDLIPDAALRDVTLLDANPVYGFNALGGALVLTTADGRSDPGFTGSLSLGRFGRREVSLAGGGARGDVSAFVALEHLREDGWRDFSPSRLSRGYADLGFDRTGGGLHLKLLGADTDLTGNGVAPVELLAARRQAVFTWPDRSQSRYWRASLHPWVALGPQTRIEATLYAQHLTVETRNGDAADIEACEDDPALLCLEQLDDDGEEVAAILTGADGQAIAAYPGDPTYAVFNRGSLRSEGQGLLVQLIDRRETGAGSNRLALGFSLDLGRSRFAASTTLGELGPDRGVTALGPVIVQPDGAITRVELLAETRYAGFFLQDRLPLGGGLSVEIGLRHNRADIVMTDLLGTALNGRHRFSRLNPGIEFDLALSPGLELRAGYAEANRAPTPAELSCADPAAPCSLANFFIADPPLAQVVARSFELGAQGRGRAGGWRYEWLASAWRTTSADDIVHVASGVRGRGYFRNAGSTRRQGFEAQLKASRGGWRLGASYAFSDATFLDTLILSSPSSPYAAPDGTIAVRPGNRLPGIPRHSLALSLDWSAALPAGRKLVLGADLSARSGTWRLGDEANRDRQVPGHVLVNLRGQLEIAPGFSLFGSVSNLFDRRYASLGTYAEIDEVDLAEVPGASDPRADAPGAPRRWTIGIAASF